MAFRTVAKRNDCSGHIANKLKFQRAVGHNKRESGKKADEQENNQSLRKVLLPMLKPGMISGFILAFTMSLDDFAVTFFTRGTIGLDTLSTYIYTDARKGGLTPELRPMITIMFLGVLVLLIVINLRKARAAKNAVK